MTREAGTPQTPPSELLGFHTIEDEAAREDYVANAFDDLLELEAEHGLSWTADGHDTLRAETIMKNVDQTNVLVPVVFLRSFSDAANAMGYFLYIGDQDNGPCRNDADARVAHLAEKGIK